MKRYHEPLTSGEQATLAGLLNRALGFSNPSDARSVVERIRGLVDGGEWPESVLARLNGPARKPPSSDAELVTAEPPASRATLSIVRKGVRAPEPPPKPRKGKVVHLLTCVACGVEWRRPAQRGRKPHRCEACR